MAKEMDRRTFIKDMAIGGAGVLAAGGIADLVFSGKKAASGTATETTAAATPETTAAMTEAVTSMTTEAAKEMSAGLTFTPGTYEATARGISSDVKVTMTFDEKSITDVKLDVSGETAGIGAEIGDEMAGKLKSAQTYDVDAVSGATVTSNAIKTAAADCIAQASGKSVEEIMGGTGDGDETKAATDWLGEEPEIANSDIKSETTCDVLVVGAGSSGLFAAAAAAEEGVKTILIEKFDHDHASGIRDTFAACDSSEQKSDGDNVDKAAAVRYLCDWSQGYTRRSLAKEWADNSGELVDWYTKVLADGGMEFRHEIDDHTLPSNYPVLDVGHSVQYGDDYYEQLTMDKVLDYATGKGLEVQYEITMVKLLKDESGRVTGLIAKNKNDEYVRYLASKGVIIATGGYSNNEDMMRALQPWTIEQTCINYSKAGSKGDGIKALLWAGAIMDTVHTSMIFDRGAIKPDQVGEEGKSSNGALFWMGSQPFLKVNLQGERFMNEYQPYDYVLHQAAMQSNHTYVTVWDSKYAEDAERFATHGCSRLYPHENGTAPVFPIDYIQGMNEQLEQDGFIVKADTIEELAEKLGLPVDTFKATVDHYNELFDKQSDDDFGKESYRLSSLTEAPFYGVRQCGGYLICTMDGIQMDDNMHPVNEAHEPIKGCYVVGDCSGNYFAGSYPNLMAGAAAGRSATFGRIAGKNAAKGI